MMIEVLKSKLHCVQVTQANLNYMGSITIDQDLMDAANMIEGEKVQIVNNNNGERFETYIIKGERGSGSRGCSKCLTDGILTHRRVCAGFAAVTAYPQNQTKNTWYQ